MAIPKDWSQDLAFTFLQMWDHVGSFFTRPVGDISREFTLCYCFEETFFCNRKEKQPKAHVEDVAVGFGQVQIKQRGKANAIRA